MKIKLTFFLSLFITSGMMCLLSSCNKEKSNTPPVASFTVSPSSGNTSTVFSFDASSSKDNEDPTTALQVRWDWENDGTFDTPYSTEKTSTHKYTQTGDFTVKLEVKDTENATGNTTKVVKVSTASVVMNTPCPGIPTFTYGGQTYSTVQIGNQCWMKENLNIGTMISGASGQRDNDTIEKYCYDNAPANCAVYGGLYQWNELMQYSTTAGAKGICPTGWHIPTDAEWCTMTSALDPTVDCSANGWSGQIVGSRLKMTGTTYWTAPNSDANNASGFTALPGGYRYSPGSPSNFADQKDFAYFWTSTREGYMNTYGRTLIYNKGEIGRYSLSRTWGASVRCVKD